MAREKGIRAGLFRPITLFPYPYEALKEKASQLSGVLVVEMNAGQMVEDVRLAFEGSVPIRFFGRMGGAIPSPDEVMRALSSMVLQQEESRLEVH
jgi:2-oxoglutarate ferredoxin oxidoreductase subunit alpha